LQQLNFHYTNGQLTSVDDNGGNVGRTITYGYDSQGNLRNVTDPLQNQIVYAYGAIGQLTQIFYPRPIHTQPPYRGFPVVTGGLPVTEQLAQDVISLPMHPYLTMQAQDRIIAAVRSAVA